jgi:hypothetical protein
LNPCGVSTTNTAACESLPSQIENFTDQFFGEVIKTEVNGQVVWSLPCSLETGLPNNPRSEGEGLACYFLRLFRDGIGGLQGPRGYTGAPGADGVNAYTVTTQAFAQPSISSPLTQIVVVPNPSIVEGLGIFVQYSGIYEVTGVANGGVLFVTFISAVTSPLATIPAGALVTPVGAPDGATGPQGPQGPQGATGIAGATVTNENGNYVHLALDTFSVPSGVWGVADFAGDTLEFTPSTAATYLVTGVLLLAGQVGAAATDTFGAQFRTSDGTTYDATTSYYVGVTNGVQVSVPVSGIVTTTGAVGQTVQLFTTTTGAAGSVLLDATGTHFSWVRLA